MQEIREQMLSPQFKEAAEQDFQDFRKFSSVSAMEINTPETKYRSTKYDTQANSLHFRNKTCEEDQFRLYDEIKELFARREFEPIHLVEPKVLFNCEYPKKITIKRKPIQQVTQNDLLIDKMYRANQLSLLF